MYLHQLREARHLRVDYVISQEHCEGLVSDEALCAEHRMAKALWHLLPYILYVYHLGYGSDFFEKVVFFL